MPTTPTKTTYGLATRQRVLDAFREGRDWKLVAEHNGISASTARRIVAAGTPDTKPRGGLRPSRVRCTPEIEAALQEYLEDNCLYTLEQMKDMVWMDFQVDLSTTTISNRLLKLMYTVKQVRVVPSTCNNEVNKAKRKAFADQLVQHQEDGDLVVYYDETNFNIYCKRSQGRALKGERATVVLPPSKGANLQLQCAVSMEHAIVCYELQHGSIKMATNAAFVDSIYQHVKASSKYQDDFAGKKIVVVLDNAPAHCQTEDRITKHDDLILLRLGPYSPMCNPIEACFSVLKSRIKSFLALGRDDMLDIGTFGTLTERRMTLLENAAKHAITCITPRLVARMTVHCQRAVEAARRGDDMEYGT
ncbi:hypothetical protein BBJ28_00019617 [Nothophytophthora sp. Chile5]|nr:hypothetical protein BBJ28_00019617 [Nothophytophthora sp. Chile5]